MLRLSLRTKATISALLVLAPVLILLIWNHGTAYDVEKKVTIADQVELAEVVSTLLVDNVFNETLTLDRSYAIDATILSLDRGRISNYLEPMWLLYPDYDDPLAVFDANGNQLGSARGYGPITVVDRDWFQDVLRTGEPTVGNLVVSKSSGNPIIPVAVPVKDGAGKVVGVTGSAISPDQFMKLLSGTPLRTGQRVFLTDRAGKLVFNTGVTELTWEQRDLSRSLPVSTALQGRPYVGEGAGLLSGEQRIVATLPTPKYGWVVGVSIPTELTLAPIEQSYRDSLIIFLAVALLSIGAALVLAEVMIRPLKRLTRHAAALGRGELQQRVEIATGDELEKLADTFNRMADEIRAREKEREDYISPTSAV